MIHQNYLNDLETVLTWDLPDAVLPEALSQHTQRYQLILDDGVRPSSWHEALVPVSH